MPVAGGPDLAALIAAHPWPMLLLQPGTGVVVAANEAAARVLGQTVSELAGRVLVEIDAALAAAVTAGLAAGPVGSPGAVVELAVAGHPPRRHELALVTVPGPPAEGAGGGMTWCSLREAPVAAPAGPLGSADSMDSGSQAEYRLLADNAADMLLRLDGGGRITYASPSWARLLGHDPAQLLGDIAELPGVHPADADRLAVMERALVDAANGGRAVRVRLRHRDGPYRWWELTARWVGPEPWAGMVLAFRDIADEVRIEEVLNLERARAQAALDSMIDPFVLLGAVRDDDGRIEDLRCLMANEAALSYLGRTRREVVGRRLREVLSGPGVDTLVDWNIGVIDTGESLVMDDVSLLSPTRGALHWFDFRAVRVGDEASFTWRNVSERHAEAERVAESEDRYRLLAENASDLVAALEVDGVPTWVSPSVAALGWEPGDLVGTGIGEFLHPDDVAGFNEVLDRARGGATVHGRWRLRARSGEYRWFRVRLRPLITTGASGRLDVAGLIAGWSDVQSEHLARAELERSEARFRQVLLSAPVGMAVVRLDRSFAQVNPALAALLGRDEQWLLHHGVGDVIEPADDAQDAKLRIDALLDGRASREHRMRRADGSIFWVNHSVGVLRDAEGRADSFVSQFADISEARQARDWLRHLANHDPLTELANRRQLHSHISAAIARQPRTGAGVAVIFIDVDRLKPINDTYGHIAGDAVLVSVAARLKARVRGGDLVARHGGDEFVVVLSGVRGVEGALVVAQDLQGAFSEPVIVEGQPIEVSVSTGVALLSPGDDPARVLARADRAVYRAKAAGRGCIVAVTAD